jgi:hypothetical protein
VTIRVPQDHATVTEAISAAPPGARIEIADEAYFEEVVIDRPLQIVGPGWSRRARMLPPDGVRTRVIHVLETALRWTGASPPRRRVRTRVIHVLETAGRITRLEGFRIEQGRPAHGSGGGILADTPISIVDCATASSAASINAISVATPPSQPGEQQAGKEIRQSRLTVVP